MPWVSTPRRSAATREVDAVGLQERGCEGVGDVWCYYEFGGCVGHGEGRVLLC